MKNFGLCYYFCYKMNLQAGEIRFTNFSECLKIQELIKDNVKFICARIKRKE